MDRKKILLASFGHMACDINGGALPASLPYIRSAYGLDYQATASLMLAYSFLSSLLQPFFGFLADRHKKPWFIPLGLILGGLGISLLGFLNNYWLMFAAITISGIGSSFFHPEGARFANRVSGNEQGAGMSFFSIGGNTGFLAGPVLVSIFVGYFGLKGMSVFVFIGLTLSVAMFWVISHMPAPTAMVAAPTKAKAILEAEEDSAQDPEAAAAEELATPKSGTSNNWREFSHLTAVIFSRAIVFNGCNTFIPLYFVNYFHTSKSVGAIALVMFSAFGVMFNILGGRLVDRLGAIPVLRIAYCSLPCVALCFGLASNAILAFAILPLLGFALYLPFSGQVVLGQNLLAKNVGFASGITLGLGSTIGGIAQPCLGWCADSFGLHSVFYILAGIAIVGTVFSFILSRDNDYRGGR